jgi:hypothetical protein
MKRLLYILPLFLICTAGYGQTTYSLSYSASALDPSSKQHLDSVEMGGNFELSVTITNKDESSFPATKIYFNRSVGKGLDFHTKETGHLSKDTLAFTALDGLGYSSTGMAQIHVTSNDFVLGDNVVIIWPSGGIAVNNNDRLDTGGNNYAIFKIKVIAKTGLNEIATSTIGMNVYPNPATSSATVNVNGVHNGMLTITDISGKMLIQQAVRGDGSSMNIPLPLNLNGTSLAEGLYFISLNTESAHCVQKLLITK